MTVAYSAAVMLYYEIPVVTGIYETLIFGGILFALGFSLWFAIRYMDIGTKKLTELSLYHLLLAGLFSYVAIFLTGRIEQLFLDELPEGLIQGKLFAGLLLYAFMLMIFYFSKYRDNIKEQSEKETELKSLLQEAELNLLKSQLNPHFIFNSLNSISSLTITNPDRARNMVVKLSEFLRYSLGKGKEETVRLEEELHNVELFLDIEKTRFGDRLNLDMQVSEGVNDTSVPILILQPLVENAVKYAVYDSIEGATISLKAFKNENFLTVTLSNPYDPKDMPGEGKGIGLNNVRQRLKLIYGDLADMSIEKTENTFTCKLLLPL